MKPLFALGILSLLVGCGPRITGFDSGTEPLNVDIDPVFDANATEQIIIGIDAWQTAVPALEFHVRIADCDQGDVCIRWATATDIELACDQNTLDCTEPGGRILLDPNARGGPRRATEHELGHALGLGHIPPRDGVAPIMCASEGCSGPGVSCLDVAAWMRLQNRPFTGCP